MKINPFQWLDRNPTFRVVGGWLLLIFIISADYLTGSVRLGPVYCLPLIMLSYDVRASRGVIVAVVAGTAWAVMGNPSIMNFLMLGEKPIDVFQAVRLAAFSWAIGVVGYTLVALGFHTIRQQEYKIELAERERAHREKELLNAIISTLNHEINNPLAIISAQTSLMQMERKPSADIESVQKIQAAVVRISSFVKELAEIEQVRLKHASPSSQLISLDSARSAEPKMD